MLLDILVIQLAFRLSPLNAELLRGHDNSDMSVSERLASAG